MDRITHHGESEPMKSESPEITAAREASPSIPGDKVFEIKNDDGSFDTGSAAELMAHADIDAAFAEQADTATRSAITCFLKFGDLWEKGLDDNGHNAGNDYTHHPF